MSVTISPRTESPRNSRRSLVTSSPCSHAKDRCVSAASRRPGSRKATPSAVSSAPSGTASGDPTWLLDLDRLAAGVVAAVGAHAVVLLWLFALRARAVRGRLGLPCRAALRGAGLALLLLGDCHRGFLLEWAVSVRVVGGRKVDQQLGENGEAGVDRVVAGALAEVAVAAARRAQTPAIGSAQRRARALHADRVHDAV